jgi:polysaccharide export outer membrane protein
MRLWLPFIASVVLFASCVSNKKVVMLQKDDVNKKNLPLDTVVRTYALDTFSYKVQPNDILYIQFQSLTNKEFDFFSSANTGQPQQVQNPSLMGDLVNEKGEIGFPVMGKVKVAGLTVFQIQEMLRQLASRYIESPVVKVRLLNYRVTFLGEVNHEGVITLVNNRVSMIEAIGSAGGFGELADRSAVKLIRQRGSQTEVQYINLLDENFFKSPYYYVNQNDVIIVPPLRQRPFRKYFTTNLSVALSTISALLLIFSLTR